MTQRVCWNGSDPLCAPAALKTRPSSPWPIWPSTATRWLSPLILRKFAESSNVAIRLNEAALPLREEVRGVCGLLGLDPFCLANEGKLLAIVHKKHADQVLAAMRMHPAGKNVAIIGDVTAEPADVVVPHTVFGGQRIVDMLVGEQLPRIC